MDNVWKKIINIYVKNFDEHKENPSDGKKINVAGKGSVLNNLCQLSEVVIMST
ncbi:protein of unknown function [Legionella micdadei]|uniref:Uncharacterized protein n=1 Tax=Legionella micdadei TaxID=451 RepID=A0A098GG87_LEGMI|nr:protein of unknown function [Legionella micdadei]